MSERLLLVDAPGGPHPRFYLPSLLEEFDVAAVWLGVETPLARDARRDALADATLTCEVGDPRDITQAVRETARGYRPAGILALSERVVHDAQLVAWELGLPANSPPTLRALRDKTVQRRLLREGGLPVPRQWTLPDQEACQRAAAQAR